MQMKNEKKMKKRLKGFLKGTPSLAYIMSK